MQAIVRRLRAYNQQDIQRKFGIQKKIWDGKDSTLRIGCVVASSSSSPPPPPTMTVEEKGLENLTVADVLTTKEIDGGNVGSWISCFTNDNVSDAVKNMAKHNIGSLVVLKPGDQQYIAGIITERDYMTKIIRPGRSSKLTKVGEIMTDETKLITVSSGTNIIKAMQLMSENHIRHVPVIDGKIVGMVSMVDVVRAIVDHQHGELKRLNDFIQGQY